jgi:hypothetical protein
MRRTYLMLLVGSGLTALIPMTLAQAHGHFPKPTMPVDVDVIDGSVDPASIPTDAAIWMTFRLVLATDKAYPGEGVNALTLSMGLSETDARKLFEYIVKVVDEERTMVSRGSERVCDRVLALPHSASADDLAAVLEDEDSSQATWRSEMIAKIPEVVGEEALAHVTAWATARRHGMQIHRPHSASFVSRIGPSVEKFVERFCAQGGGRVVIQ